MQPLSEPNAGWRRLCIRETQLSTPCLRTLISDSNPHSGGFLSRREPLAKSAPMWRLRVFWELWRVCACRLIIKDQSTPAAWSPCLLTGCAMARSQRRANFLSITPSVSAPTKARSDGGEDRFHHVHVIGNA